MRSGFLNSAEDCQWLREVHLRGVPLPAKYAGFQSFVLQGNEDAPHAVNLYVSADPLYTDNYYRFQFDCTAPIYCEACECDGKTNTRAGVQS